jgi:gas vesicle protein
MAEQTMPNMPSTASTLMAFVVGIGAGAVAGMLLTPRSGQETRQQIKDKMRQARMQAQEKMREQKDMAKERMEQLKEGSKRVRRAAQETAEDLRET